MSLAMLYRLLLVANLVVLGIVLRFDHDMVTMWIGLSTACCAYAVGRKSGEKYGAQHPSP